MVCALGGHSNSLTKSDVYSSLQREERLLRRLFWLCYISDKDISLRSGHPPLLTEDNCDLTLLEISSGLIPESDERKSQATVLPFSLYYLELCFLKEKVYRELFSYRASRLADGSVLLRIRQMDNEVESWRSSIPTECRPKLSINSCDIAPSPPISSPENTLRIFLQFEYHYMMTIIHTTVRKCGADSIAAGNLPDDLHSAIHSSCDISLEASRSTINFMVNEASTLKGEEIM